MLGSFWIVWKRNTIKELSILQHSTIGDLSINSAPFVSSTSGGRKWKQTLYNLPLYLITFLCRIYSRLEENDEDALYFFTKAGLGSDFRLVRENVQGEKGKAANVDMTHERSTENFFSSQLPNPLFNSDFGVKLSPRWCRSWTSPGPTNTTSSCLVTLRNNTLNRWISANSLPFPKRRL